MNTNHEHGKGKSGTPAVAGVSGTALQAVYRAVRAAGHDDTVALRCMKDVSGGLWVARDIGEMRAQLALLMDDAGWAARFGEMEPNQ